MKRVVHVIGSLDTGGAERNVLRLIEGTRDRFDHSVVTISRAGRLASRLQQQGVQVQSLGVRGSGWRATFRELQEVMRAQDADVIHSWMHHANVAVSVLGGLKAPVIWGIRTVAEPLRERFRTGVVMVGSALLARLPSRIIYNSHSARRSHERLGYPVRSGVVIPNGLDVREFDAEPAAVDMWRQSHGIAAGARVLLVLGRLHPVKGHHQFLHAFRDAIDTAPGWIMLIMGREDGVTRSSLAIEAGRMGIDKRLRFADESESVRLALHAAEAVASPSLWGESFPNVVAEAMAAGRPVIASDLGDVRDIVGNTGHVIPPANLPAWTSALKSAMQRSPQESQAVGRTARSRIETHYALSAFLERYAACLDDA